MGKPTLAGKLVVAISSRALFDLTESHRIYTVDGVDAYHRYQVLHEDEVLAPGPAFVLVKKLLRLNRPDKQYVEVILLSRNSADTGLRVFNSIKHYGLDITRAAFTKGEPTSRYVPAFGAHLFLSADQGDVRRALDEGHAAATIFPSAGGHERDRRAADRVRRRRRALFRRGGARLPDGRPRRASRRANRAPRSSRSSAGRSRNSWPDCTGSRPTSPRTRVPLRTALVTARSAPAHERVIRTLRAWNIRIDEALFLGARQGRIPARVSRRHLLRRPAHARGVRAEACRGRPRAARRGQRRKAADPVSAPANPFTLADWRHTVAEHYAAVRALAGSDAPAAAAQFRAARKRLMREHPDSPIAPERAPRGTGPAGFATTRRSACAARSMRRTPRDNVRDLARVGRDAALHARRPRAIFARRTRSRRSRCTGSRAMAAACGCHSPTRSSRQPKPTAVAVISTTRSRAPTSALSGADDRARLQLRLQPVVRVRRPLVVSAVAAGEPACRSRSAAGERMP